MSPIHTRLIHHHNHIILHLLVWWCLLGKHMHNKLKIFLMCMLVLDPLYCNMIMGMIYFLSTYKPLRLSNLDFQVTMNCRIPWIEGFWFDIIQTLHLGWNLPHVSMPNHMGKIKIYIMMINMSSMMISLSIKFLNNKLSLALNILTSMMKY